MRRIIIVGISVIFLCLTAYPQKQYDFATIDSKITEHYTAGNWDSVIYYGKAGIADSIDYFFLRKHLGEAYYYKKDYLSAIPHFENALKKNSNDIATQEFLYYCYLYSGRESDAFFFGAGMTDAAKNDVHLKKNTFLKNIYFETGPAFSNNINKNENINLAGKENLGGNTDLTDNIYYAHFGLAFSLGKWISIYPGVSYINDKKLQIFQINEHKPAGRNIHVRDTVIVHPGPPPFTSYDTIYENRQIMKSVDSSLKFNYNLKQLEFYLKGNLHLTKGLDVVPFFHLLNVRTTLFKVRNNPINFFSKDTIILQTQIPHPPMMTPFDTIIYQYVNTLTPIDRFVYDEKDTSYYNYSLGLSVNKSWGKISTVLFATFSNLNNKKQKEAGLTINWYPEGNLNLYFSSTLTAFNENKTRNFVFNQLAGTKINKFIWLEGFVTIGSFSDFTETNGFVVNNNPDLVKFRCGISPIFIFKKFDLFLTYQFLEKEGSYYTDISQTEYITRSLKYKNYFIIGGIKWKI